MEVKLVNQSSSSSIKQANQYGIPDPAIRTQAGKLYSFGGWLRSGGINQPSEHWLEWNTTRTGENTNDIPPAPWPLYFTPHLTFGTEPTAWTYFNRVFIMPDGFPNVELRHRYTIDQPGTGSVFFDNVFFRELPALSDPHWMDLIPFGANWRYTTTLPPDDWAAESFDASAWAEAPAKFGGGTGTHAIVTPLPLMQPAYWFRRQFAAPATKLEELLLAATATDDFNGQTYPLQVYLNGTVLGAQGIDAVTGDGEAVKYYDLLPFCDLIHPGMNSIAVMLHNGWASDWDNVAFDLSLKAIALEAPTGEAQFSSIRLNPDGSVIVGIVGPSGTHWRIESANSPSALATWQTVQSVVLSDQTETVVVDSAAGELLDSGAQGSRFYRMQSE